MAHVSGNPTWTNTSSTPVNDTALENIEAVGDFTAPLIQTTWLPSNNSMLAWTYDPLLAGASVGSASGAMFSAAIPVGGAASITGIVVNVTGANASLTTGRNFVGLYNPAGTLVATTGDQSTNWGSTGTKQMAFSGGPVTANQGIYYVWTLVNTSSGTVSFGAVSSTGPVNLNRSVAFYRSGYVTTSNTVMPSTAPTPSATLNPMWAALY